MAMQIFADGVAREVPWEPPPELPEFGFSPRIINLTPPRPRVKHPVLPEEPPRSIWGRDWRPLTKRIVSPAEEKWLQGELVFTKKDPKPKTKPPVNTMHPFQQDLENADNDLRFLIDSQCCSYHAQGGNNFEHSSEPLEMPTSGQEMALLMLPSVRLEKSSSQDDDDQPSLANFITENRDMDRYGVPLMQGDPEWVALQEAIALERYNYHCGPRSRYWLTFNKNGELITASERRTDLITDEIQLRLAKISGLLDGRDPLDLTDSIHAVRYYKRIGSFLHGHFNKKGPHPTSTFVPLDKEIPDEEPEQGPTELGMSTTIPTEETPEATLWEVTFDEIIWNINHGINLSEVEQRWLQRRPKVLETLERAGFKYGITF